MKVGQVLLGLTGLAGVVAGGVALDGRLDSATREHSGGWERLEPRLSAHLRGQELTDARLELRVTDSPLVLQGRLEGRLRLADSSDAVNVVVAPEVALDAARFDGELVPERPRWATRWIATPAALRRFPRPEKAGPANTTVAIAFEFRRAVGTAAGPLFPWSIAPFDCVRVMLGQAGAPSVHGRVTLELPEGIEVVVASSGAGAAAGAPATLGAGRHELPDLLDDRSVLLLQDAREPGSAGSAGEGGRHSPAGRPPAGAAGRPLQLESFSVALTGRRRRCAGELILGSAPPDLAPRAVELLFVGSAQSHRERVLVTGGRAAFRNVELAEAPLVLVFDPERRFALADDRARVLPLELEPVSFAVTADAGVLAVALRREGERPVAGISVLEGSDAGLEVVRWLELKEAPRALEWAVPRRFLAFRGGGREKPAAVLDVMNGGLRPLDGPAQVNSRGGLLFTEVERAPGCFAQSFLDLRVGRGRPLGFERHAAAEWVRGADEFLTTAPDGRARLADLDGAPRIDLPWLHGAVRDLRRLAFGYGLVTESVRGSELRLVTPRGELVDTIPVEGRLRGWHFAADSGSFLLISVTGPGEHIVTRVRYGETQGATQLYRGPDRPLADLPLQKGVILVAADGERDGAPCRLLFRAFDAENASAAAPRLVSAEAFLEPSPVIASAGRYLYYLRVHGGPPEVPGAWRPRALYRYDFLASREEPLKLAGESP